MSFTPLNNCPICNGKRSDCREGDTGLIHCRAGLDAPPGWKRIKEDGVGFTMYGPDNGTNHTRIDNPKDYYNHKNGLAADEFYRACEWLKALWGLEGKHRHDLEQRGLTPEQIDQGGFFSTRPDAELPNDFPDRFPGVIHQGGKLSWWGDRGYACPIWDGEYIHGVQVKVDGGKYKWIGWQPRKGAIATTATSKLPIGEMPITAVGLTETGAFTARVGIAEGVLKPYVAASRHGHSFIGSAGANFGKQQLEWILDDLTTDNEIYIAVDAGAIANKGVLTAYAKIYKAIATRGLKCQFGWWGQSDKKSGRDIDEITPDELLLIDYDDFLEKISGNLRGEFDSAARGVDEPETEEKKSTNNPIEVAEVAIANLGEVWYNIVAKEIEINGEEIHPDTLWVEACRGELYAPKSTFRDVLYAVARRNDYNPIKDYLQTVGHRHGTDTSILDGLAFRLFGTEERIHQVMLIRWLIGCVARVMSPGCKFDDCLVAQGKQGAGKSTFFRVLASEDYFTDSCHSLNTSDKDTLLKAHKRWICEVGELEHAYSKADIGEIKRSLSACSDQFRPPYMSKTETHKRMFVPVGTANEEKFLNDTTGNRRFWVIPVKQDIDIEWVRCNRDRLWAAAYTLYMDGEQWWLTDLERAEQNVNNKRFESEDHWEDLIQSVIDKSENPRADEFQKVENRNTAEWMSLIGVDPSRATRRDQRRLQECLIRMGWVYKNSKVDGRQKKIWVKVDELPEKSSGNRSGNRSGNQQNRCPARDLGDLSPPVTSVTSNSETFSPNQKNDSLSSGRLDNDCDPVKGLKNSGNQVTADFGESETLAAQSLDPVTSTVTSTSDVQVTGNQRVVVASPGIILESFGGSIAIAPIITSDPPTDEEILYYLGEADDPDEVRRRKEVIIAKWGQEALDRAMGMPLKTNSPDQTAPGTETELGTGTEHDPDDPDDSDSDKWRSPHLGELKPGMKIRIDAIRTTLHGRTGTYTGTRDDLYDGKRKRNKERFGAVVDGNEWFFEAGDLLIYDPNYSPTPIEAEATWDSDDDDDGGRDGDPNYLEAVDD